MNSKSDLVVIGGGAAGLMCAITAAERGVGVTLLDPNKKLGRKVRITGKGRCNVTNNCDIKGFMENIPSDGRFLYSALNRLSPADTIDYFESHGVKLKTERGNRVFPVSDNANEVADMLAEQCSKLGVKIIRTTASRILTENGAVSAVETGDGIIKCAAAAVCTGGMSYPLTGSKGDGYKFARQFGHNIIQPRASLVPLESDDEYCGEMQGFSLRNVSLSLYEDDKLIYKELGELLFTHFGLSGPLVLSASSHMRNRDNARYAVKIDLKPALDEKKLDARILRDFELFSNREFKNSLDKLAGKTMIPVLVKLSGISPEQKVNTITHEQRMRLVKLFKEFPVSVSGTRPIEEAIITSGGVDTKEINPRTMESKLVEGLYFAGEVLNLDGYTGGFNLQIAWSTGFVAGKSVLKDEIL